VGALLVAVRSSPDTSFFSQVCSLSIHLFVCTFEMSDHSHAKVLASCCIRYHAFPILLLIAFIEWGCKEDPCDHHPTGKGILHNRCVNQCAFSLLIGET